MRLTEDFTQWIDHEYLAIQVQQRARAAFPDLLTHLYTLSVSDNVVNFP